MSEQIIKLESALKTFKNNLSFAKRTNSKQRKTKYQNLIYETERQILELGITNSVAINTDLRGKIDNLTHAIDKLQEAKDIVDKELNEKIKKLDNALNPLKPKVEQEKTEPEPIPTVQPVILKDEPEAEPEGKISCPECGAMVNGERGLRAHKSRWCPVKHGVKTEVVNH